MSAVDLIGRPDGTRELLGCGLDRLEVDLGSHIAVLRLPASHSTDMAGAIALVTAIDPECRVIHTIAGAERDTRYVRRNGAWRAHDERRRRS